VRPSGGGGACFIFVWGGRRRPEGPGGSEAEKNPFRKIGILNLPRLWKFVQGDFRGILTQ
jgi:hypothetical protein